MALWHGVEYQDFRLPDGRHFSELADRGKETVVHAVVELLHLLTDWYGKYVLARPRGGD